MRRDATRPSGSERPVVLHVATRFIGGGSEQRILDCVAAVEQARHHLVVGEMDDIGRRRCPAVVVEIEPMLERTVNPVNDTRALRRLSSTVRRLRPDLIVTHQSKAGVLGRIAARRSHVQAVHSLSMTSFGEGYSARNSALYRSVERLLIPATACYAAVGDDLASRYRQIGVPPEKLRIVRSRVSLPSAPHDPAAAKASLMARHGWEVDRPLVAYVGSLEPRKGVLALPALLAGLHESVAGTKPVLLVAGQGPLRESLERELHERGLGEDSRMPGHVRDVDVLFAAADVVVLPSTSEGLPQVLVQASAAGTPWVAYDVCGVNELIAAGAAGTAVPLGDVSAMYRAVAAWLGVPRRGPGIDLSSWDEGAIRTAWSDVVLPLLPSEAGHGAWA